MSGLRSEPLASSHDRAGFACGVAALDDYLRRPVAADNPFLAMEKVLSDAVSQGLNLYRDLRDWGLANPRNVKFKTSDFATILTMSYLVWPYAVILLYPALSRLDPSLSEAARTMGAGRWTVTRTVTLPSIRLPLYGTTLLLFVFLLGTYVTVTVFAAPNKHTTAVAIYSNIRGANLNAPFGATQAVILLISASVCLVAGHMLNRWAEAR